MRRRISEGAAMGQSISDEFLGKIVNLESAEKAMNTAKTGMDAALQAAKGSVKGICLLIDTGEFTAEHVMQAVNAVLLQGTGNIKFSKNNISISDLQKKEL